MQLGNLEAYLETELQYPVDLDSVLDHIGSTEVEAPDTTGSETIETILRPLGTDTYNSATELLETILGNLSDEYIGRKFYDDRGGNQLEVKMGPTDEADVSF
ncbi:hypothetical protein [Haloarchaeobius sp. HME9146]|uniref:DUF5789 family protein n=1 Tax=Haloarchaeobius sp. HME9146 TaxID=2978732 RepID=UPI0021BE463D|nr:hypothetical protein [Haloarchaeobius sp. HME9146]MCT9094896.1 hypothetical protein [Haloarchaeobius sp. HME9146]